MKKLIALLTVLLLVLTACKPSRTDPAGSAGTTAPAVTEEPTLGTTEPSSEATEPTPEATEPPSETTEPAVEAAKPPEQATVPKMSDEARQVDHYSHGTDTDSYPFVHNGIEQYMGLVPLENLTIGCLYVYDKSLDTHFLITDQPLAFSPGYHNTGDHIFYVLEAEPTKIVRASLTGQDPITIYTSEYGAVNCVHYHGADAYGKLLITEGNTRVILYDIPTGSIEVLLEQDYIRNAWYESGWGGEDFILHWNDENGWAWFIDPETGEPAIRSKL